ncbi:MAG: ribosome maturation factor RimP [Deltaproteobacteria bacterium]|nr:ribosome maturation factor RimP [Deltaproteobacteria bacterium]
MIQGLEEKVRGLALPVAEGYGVRLVDIAYVFEEGRRVLRILIDKPGGVTVEDCAKVSRELSTILDVEDMMPESYSLEVSSPGLDRPLIREKDFIGAVGHKVRIRTKKPVEGRRNFKNATLEGIEEGNIVVKDADGKLCQIELSNIDRARLEIVI